MLKAVVQQLLEGDLLPTELLGLVQWAYGQAGIALPRTTQEQVLVGQPVSVDKMRPGDLVFTRSNQQGRVIDFGHVAIYAGGGMEIVAPHTGVVVRLQNVQPGSVQRSAAWSADASSRHR